MALFFAERNAAKKWHFFREAKNGEKLYFSRCEIRRKMVQFWAVSWVEPVFREIFRENGTFFRGVKCGEKWRFVVGEKWRKMALSKRNLSGKICENGTFETKNRLSPSQLCLCPKHIKIRQ
jgi:hypothetical protein